MSIFLGALKLISGTKYKVNRVFYNPPVDYKPVDGPGVMIDTIPDPHPPAGMGVANTYVDTATKAVTYDYIEIGDGSGQIYDPNDLDSVKAYKKVQINKISGEKIDGGYYSYAEGYKDAAGNPVAKLYKSDRDHREQIDTFYYGLVQAHKANLKTDEPCTWKDASIEGACHQVSDAVITQLWFEKGELLKWGKTTADKLVDAINACTTNDEVNAITFPDYPMPTVPTATTTTGAAT